MRKLILSAFMAFTLLAQPAFAAIDEAGAIQLKKLVDESLAYQRRMGEMAEQGIELSGDVTVTPKKDFYEVRLPGLALSFPGTRLNVGTIVINATPGKKGEYLTSMALPQNMKAIDDKGNQLFDVKIGKQRFAGAWVPELRGYTKVDAEYNDLVVQQFADNNATAKVGTLKVSVNLTENADKTWSGPGTGYVRNVAITARPKNGKAVLDIGIAEMTGSASYDSLNIAASRAMEDKVLAALKENEGKSMTPEKTKALFASVLKDATVFMNGMTSDFTMTGLAVNLTPQADETKTPAGEAKKPLNFKIAKLSSSVAAKDFQKEKGSAAFKVLFDGIVYPDIPSDFKSVVPTSSNFDIALENLPMKSLVKLFSEFAVAVLEASIQEEAAKGEAPKAGAQMEFAKSAQALPGLLANAGAKVTIRDSYTRSPDLVTRLEGSFTAQPPALSLIPLSGTMTLTMEGMDELTEKFRTIGTPKTIQYADTLALAQVAGQLSKSNGRSLRTYKFDVTPDGQMLLNGVDIKAMGSMMGLKPAVP